MLYIAHRGNTNGRKPERENTLSYINEAMADGFHVEVDVWVDADGGILLGHDGPHETVELEYLKNDMLWCHAKNIYALETLIHENRVRCFWHDRDEHTLTSKGDVWSFPGVKMLPSSVYVMPETTISDFSKLPSGTKGHALAMIVSGCRGACSDHVRKIREFDNSDWRGDHP